MKIQSWNTSDLLSSFPLQVEVRLVPFLHLDQDSVAGHFAGSTLVPNKCQAHLESKWKERLTSEKKNKPRYKTLQRTVSESSEQPFKKGRGINEYGERYRRMKAYCSLSHEAFRRDKRGRNGETKPFFSLQIYDFKKSIYLMMGAKRQFTYF